MRYPIFCFVLFISFSLVAQTGYKIDFKIKGIKDTTVYLAYYYGENTHRSDTARADKNGAFSFSGKNILGQGVYRLIFAKGKELVIGFDFVIGKDQQFLMETSSEDYVKNMKITGDEDNKIFFESLTHDMERGREASSLLKILNDSTILEVNKKEAREGFQNITKQVMTYRDGIIQKYPNSITARMLKASKPIEIPDAPTLPNGQKDQTFQYQYYKKHFFDNFDLADEALIRMPRPFYVDKLKEYLDKMVAPQPDSLIKEIDRLAALARKNKETYKYLVWICLVKYQTPEIMGFDAIYVHLYDRYFASKEMDFWINAKTKQNLKDHADQFRLSLIGMTAPNLVMQDLNLKPRSMYDIKNKYTILFIFNPECSACREETPRLVNFYNAHRTKFDVEVYAVSSDSSLKKMKDFIHEFKTPWITVNGPRSYVGSYQKLYDADKTPTMYIIDNRKKIIAKKPPIEKLEEFLTHYEDSQKKKAAGGK
jgi:peroxiredoxin